MTWSLHQLPDFRAYLSPHSFSTLVTMTTVQPLKHPTTGPLHLLFPLPGTRFPQIYTWMTPSPPSGLCSKVTVSERPPPTTCFKIAHTYPHHTLSSDSALPAFIVFNTSGNPYILVVYISFLLPECGHYRLCSSLHPQPWNGAWHTADLNTHLLHEGRDAGPHRPRHHHQRRGEGGRGLWGTRSWGRASSCPKSASARTAPTRRAAQTESVPSCARGASPKTSLGRGLGPMPGCDQKRGGVGTRKDLDYFYKLAPKKTAFLLS